MGQAKLRGTFEQRRAAAIERNTKQAEEEHRQKVAWWNSLSAEDQDAIRNKRNKSAAFMAFFAGILAGTNSA